MIYSCSLFPVVFASTDRRSREQIRSTRLMTLIDDVIDENQRGRNLFHNDTTYYADKTQNIKLYDLEVDPAESDWRGHVKVIKLSVTGLQMFRI